MTSNDASIRRYGRGSHCRCRPPVFVGVRVYGSEVGKLCRHVTTAVWRGSVVSGKESIPGGGAWRESIDSLFQS
jgi:hypothetical protein